jgi:uncharacterized protein (TIGR04141 family)
MAEEKKVYQLTVFLVKESYATVEQVIRTDVCQKAIDVAIAGHESGKLFVRRSDPSPPKWANLFAEYVDFGALLVAGVAAAFYITVGVRHYVLVFGQAGRFLLKEDVHEERFGLLCTLNSVGAESLRCVDVQSLDAIQSHSRIQAGEASSPDQFGLNVEQDMLRAVVGKPVNPALGNRMAGSDSLSVAVPLNLADLPTLLNEYRQRFESDLKDKDYEWVNNIALTKSAATIAQLEAALDERMSKKDFVGMWLSIPEIINWDEVSGFIYTHGKNVMHPDISMQGFLSTIGAGEVISLDLLRVRRVSCANAEHKRTFREWSVYKCLYAEVDLDDGKFILNDGAWFKVASDFVAATDKAFSKIPRSKLSLPLYQDDGEGEYNARVAASFPDQFALLDDTQKIMHGGGYGQVEVCDLFSQDRELIHVKMYGKSSVFSHLFAQGFVSGQLMQIDPTFRKKVRQKLKTPFSELIPEEEKPKQDEFTVVYAVISSEPGANLMLPFFSRVNVNNTARILRGYGYKVELLKIQVDLVFAKTVKAPPSKKKG